MQKDTVLKIVHFAVMAGVGVGLHYLGVDAMRIAEVLGLQNVGFLAGLFHSEAGK